jgi:hypothetical protein
MAGSKKDTFESDILKLIFQNIALANIGNAGGLQPSTVAGNLYVALFKTTAPSDSVQGTELAYTGYTRVAVARSSGGWTIAGTNPTNCSNAALVTFGICTGAAPETAISFAICKAGTSGVDDAIYWGDLNAPLVINVGITPEFAIGDIDINED